VKIFSYTVNKIRQIVMGLATSRGKNEEFKLDKEQEQPTVTLEDSEIDFILEKLKTATYTGFEFEMFYKVWVKLTKYRR